MRKEATFDTSFWIHAVYLDRVDFLKQELLTYAAGEYRAGQASLSELATLTGLDVPTIMEEIARISGEDTRAVDGFLSAVETLSRLHNDPEFLTLARKAIQ